ncbi:MAG TPA: class I SAM-dependent methyltransferase [Candidatus Deferrimicrobium sp.]|nr:class I SAM-dependent methyltransferase [Candidatus Deferrimicrobium sp.]
MQFDNVYEDNRRAEAYAKLEYPGTYYLAYRDLPAIISEHVRGRRALDFGCGTGRSTRFLRSLGFDTIGIDIAQNMIGKAREIDPRGDYRLIVDDSLVSLQDEVFDLVLAAFTFDNIATMQKKISLFKCLGSLLDNRGTIVNLVSSPEIYTHEWASFTTKDFPENRLAKSGDRVRIIMKDVEDQRPVEDILCDDQTYREVYKQAGLEPINMYKPLAREYEPYEWVDETRIAPWVIYVLGSTKLRAIM